MFPRITEYVHMLMKERVREGDHVIDATMGNGHDTAFLAHLVGPAGRVYAYDIQPEAIASTSKRLKEEDVSDRAELFLRSHTEMDHEPGTCSFIVFNLGYLPRYDKTITTRAETTIPAIQRALNLVKVGGLVLLVIYWGHSEGKKEKEEVEAFVQNLPYPEYMALKYDYVNVKNEPPFVLAIERRK